MEAVLDSLCQSWKPSWAILADLEAGCVDFLGFLGFMRESGGPAGWAEPPLGMFLVGPNRRLENLARQAPLRKRQGAADLLAFGPSRHRACVVVQRPLGYSMGSREKPLGSPNFEPQKSFPKGRGRR